ncbi:hypothetical protein R5W23_001095 [Gemmata sp. JC673]|uniref:Uncharacterized protein n=1 Tax=Gemmata algarum TaxID=2975278 RepID=A0ABU5EY84_9BACT|nr:hypothetical protein [Gemmata algarum]MDY3559909.1 hypothetical protein [Gemmata algarum]
MTALLLLSVTLSAPPAAPPTAVAVRPAAAPKPALKYQLLPEVRELKPGNAAQWYLRCFMEQRQFFFSKEGVAQRTRYQSMTLKELREEGLQNYGGSALTQADWGARLETVDWQVLDRVQTEGPDLRLPELEPLHRLAVSLQIRLRGEIARGDFDDAVRTTKTMTALARHLGEYPTAAAARLGLKVANLALDALWELVQQPNAPNLYWALTDLPAPLVDLRRGLQGDRALADSELKLFRDDRAMTGAETDEIVGRLSGRAGYIRQRAGLPPHDLRTALTARAQDAGTVRAARARLIEAGAGQFAVGTFSDVQVVLLDDKREYEIARDDRLKQLGLKAWEIDARATDARCNGLFADLLPRVTELRHEQARFEQRVALLRHVEALRLFAATGSGALPVSLTEVGVPVPDDPFTGKPFAYTLSGGVAQLRGAAPKGEEKNPHFAAAFDVTLGSPEGARPPATTRDGVKK